MEAHFICGNHDAFYKNTNEINALRELIGETYTIKLYEKLPEEVIISDRPILFVPWIANDNRDESLDIINKSTVPLCIGHLELTGFEMESGEKCLHGTDPEIFKHFEKVYSGHFHQPSRKNNI
jgi:hypothetical protein